MSTKKSKAKRNNKGKRNNKSKRNNKLAGNPFSKYETIFNDMDAKMSFINLSIKDFNFKDFNIKQKEEALKIKKTCIDLNETSKIIVDHLCKRCLVTERNIPLIQKRIEQLEEYIKKFDRQKEKQINKDEKLAVSMQKTFDRESQSI